MFPKWKIYLNQGISINQEFLKKEDSMKSGTALGLQEISVLAMLVQ